MTRYCRANKGRTVAARTAIHAVRALLLLIISADLQAATPPEISAPEPDTLLLKGSAVRSAARIDTAVDALTMARRVQQQLDISRQQGSPRPLGEARRLLDQLDQRSWRAQHWWLSATVRQRLHDFDGAETDLAHAINMMPNDPQIHFSAFSVAMAQGKHQDARRYCMRFSQLAPGYLAQACEAQWLAGSGDADKARTNLRRAMAASHQRHDVVGFQYAISTLAELEAATQPEQADRLWQLALALDPDDLYSRSHYCQWLLDQRRLDDVLRCSHGYDHVDALAVTRVQALQSTDPAAAAALADKISARIAQASWRGDWLHAYEYALFLLDVRPDPAAALEMARRNWQQQRRPEDAALLARAENALTSATDH
jgi:tetratricopeptide (TPR) repeat protein